MKNLKISDNARQSIVSVNLSFSNPASSSSQADLIDIFQRIEAGNTSHEQEEARLLDKWRKAKVVENKTTKGC